MKNLTLRELNLLIRDNGGTYDANIERTKHWKNLENLYAITEGTYYWKNKENLYATTERTEQWENIESLYAIIERNSVTT